MNHDHNPISRRYFLKYSASAMTVVALGTTPRPGFAFQARRPRFTFVQVNDIHSEAPKRGAATAYAKANEKLRWWVEEMNRGPTPDFVVGVGDMIHGETLDRLPKDMEYFRRAIEPLRCPFYPAMGNHEVVQREGIPEYEAAYRDVFGNDRVNYAFEHGGIVFIMLNNSGAPAAPADVRKARNDWFKAALEEHAARPKIVCCHIPLIPVREEAVLAKSFGFRSYQAHDTELLAHLDRHAKTTLAVLSGHLHLTGCVRRKGIHHISIAGTASYPSDYARYEVWDDRIEMEVRQLPKKLAESQPSLHGMPRHAGDFTDADHETAHEYQCGREDERRLAIVQVK